METDFISACAAGVYFKVIASTHKDKTYKWNKEKSALEVSSDFDNIWYKTNANVSLFQPHVIIVDKPFKKVKRTFEEAVNILKDNPHKTIFVRDREIQYYMGMLIYKDTRGNVRDVLSDYGLISLEFIEHVPS